jgi:hypothetical protein
MEDEVLVNEVLGSSEVLVNEDSFSQGSLLVFECLIECLFKKYESLVGDFVSETVTNETINELLKKIWGAAAKIHSVVKDSKTPLPEYRELSGLFGDTGEVNPVRESTDQIKAYTDYCRLTNTYVNSDPEKIPETIIRQDWCEKLKVYVDNQVSRKLYDPVLDEDLLSEWVTENYYDVITAYIDKGSYRRIVWCGASYIERK